MVLGNPSGTTLRLAPGGVNDMQWTDTCSPNSVNPICNDQGGIEKSVFPHHSRIYNHFSASSAEKCYVTLPAVACTLVEM